MNEFIVRNPHCCICGRFVSWQADYSTCFGGALDYEPPEPDYFCSRCAEESKQQCIKRGYLPGNWIPAKWEIEAAEILGMVRAGPKGAGWGRWCRREQLPEGYVIQSWK